MRYGSLNVGILGHVDCGKTTLTRRIADVASTAAFDKHAESGGRRNTLDLGFSSMMIADRRLAIIDCPGHAGLIRAVLAASTVFDMAIVVIDASSGIQAQTAEHLLLCSIFCPSRVVMVLSKIDLLGEDIEIVKKKIRKGIKAIGIDASTVMVEMSLIDPHFQQESLDRLKSAVQEMLFEPSRSIETPLQIAVDHCFGIKGKGTVVTGTVTDGCLRVGDSIEFAAMNETRKIRNLESWKMSKSEVVAGERAAFLINNFDENRFSRCIVGSPGSMIAIQKCLAEVHPIPFFRSTLSSNTKMHISIGFETIMAECQFLREFGDEFEFLGAMSPPCVVLLVFDKPVYVSKGGSQFLMASRLEQIGKGCRFAFHGRVRRIFETIEDRIIRFSRKHRKGFIERIEKDGRSAICGGMFKAETDFGLFRNMQIITSNGITGRIEGAFGKNGKFRVVFEQNSSNLCEKIEIEMFLKKYLDNNSIVSYIPENRVSLKESK